MKRLTFGQQASIDAVAEWQGLLLRLSRYKKLRTRGKMWRGKPVAAQPCVGCENLIVEKERYFSAGADSAHEACALKMVDRKAELDPAMGVRNV